MTTMVNWLMMTQKGRTDKRIDQLFDMAFNHRDMVAHDNKTVLGRKALDQDVPLPQSPATPWLISKRMDRLKNLRPDRVAAPHAEVTQIPSGLLIELRLPRLVRESVNIGVRDNILTVTGEQAVPTVIDAEGGPGPQRFQRNFSLPSAADQHKINAFCQGEVLRIIVFVGNSSN